jgi:hypothetical protein
MQKSGKRFCPAVDARDIAAATVAVTANPGDDDGVIHIRERTHPAFVQLMQPD